MATWKPSRSTTCKPSSMWTIKQSGQFKRDLKREAKGPYRQTLQREFIRLVEALANDQPLAEKHRDHFFF